MKAKIITSIGVAALLLAQTLEPASAAFAHRGGARAGPRGGAVVHRGGAYVGPRGGAVAHRGTAVVGPRGNVAVRNRTVVRGGGWARPGNYWWRPGGAVVAGAAIGFVAAATAASWAGAAPGPNMCWYYTDVAHAGFLGRLPLNDGSRA
jgi:hypothetical protein